MLNYFFFRVNTQIAMPAITPIAIPIAPIIKTKLVPTRRLNANAYARSRTPAARLSEQAQLSDYNHLWISCGKGVGAIRRLCAKPC